MKIYKLKGGFRGTLVGGRFSHLTGFDDYFICDGSYRRFSHNDYALRLIKKL